MARTAPNRILEPVTAPQHFVPPTARDLRTQAVHRLQVGLFGLCAMLLLVGLANIIMDRARLSDAEDAIQEVIAVDAEPKKPATDPLADIGVVPSADPTPSQGSGASSGAAEASATPKARARSEANPRSSPDAAGRSLRDSPGPLVGQ